MLIMHWWDQTASDRGMPYLRPFLQAVCQQQREYHRMDLQSPVQTGASTRQLGKQELWEGHQSALDGQRYLEVNSTSGTHQYRKLH